METNLYPDQPSYPNAKRPGLYNEGMEFEDFCRERCLEIGLVLNRYSSRKYQFEKGDGKIDEIKLDNRFTDTRRLSIEIAEKSREVNPYYVPSGIYAKSNFWLYIQGNYDLIFVFSRKTLQRLHKEGLYREHQKPTIISYYLPVADAIEHCEMFIVISELGKSLVDNCNQDDKGEVSDY